MWSERGGASWCVLCPVCARGCSRSPSLLCLQKDYQEGKLVVFGLDQVPREDPGRPESAWPVDRPSRRVVKEAEKDERRA